MDKVKGWVAYFTPFERLLWCASVSLITASYLLFQQDGVLTLIASLVGATALIFIAKGNPLGQVLTVVFSILYAIISFSYAYYGEVATYLGMTAPMALIALIAWLRNPYQGDASQVRVNHLRKKEYALLILLTAAVTVAFYFILGYFHTANLLPSTLSVMTSFAAAYLTFRRSPYYALAYALNDVVLIVLWALATVTDISYLSVTVCFAMFLVNDLYGFVNWRRMDNQQNAAQ
jgi:nicotinamide mononucleotide transporter PnuC